MHKDTLIFEELTKLKDIKSVNDKQAYIKELSDKESPTIEVVKFLLDPAITTGIDRKKIGKRIKYDEHPNMCLMDLLEYLKKNNTGRKEDLAIVKSFLYLYPEQYRETIIGLITKTLKIGLTAKTLNKVIPESITILEFMRAKGYMERVEKGFFDYDKEYVVSEKIDGVRCAIIKDKDGNVSMFSRQGKEIFGLDELKEIFKSDKVPSAVYDGELLHMGVFDTEEERFQKTCSVINLKLSDKKDISFIAFDKVDVEDFFEGYSDAPYIDRHNDLINTLSTLDSNIVFTTEDMDFYRVGKVSHFQLMEMLEECDDMGKEGIMINLADAPYKGMRTDAILKLKKDLIADVRIVDFIEGNGKNKGVLGSLVVEFRYDGIPNRCNVGSGFTEDERYDIWNNKEYYLNKIIEVKYQKITQNESGLGYALGFASYNHRIRDDKNETNV
ncbi:ATP-dependent DNA ligase [Peptostreptococcus faecalis]|uniref:ATP-dependent DNA ligase n=1 Tax=Peptostreptococcus faecalis TaxID=2045015 RepID=UPI000C7B6F92|nr:hypothetical protein [Peptostreptococcus faecalis]